MRLKSAARYFDTCPVYDAYSGAYLFKMQTSTFLESAVEGSTAARRVVSLDPALTPPTHSAILAVNVLMLLGGETIDEWAGEAIRKAYWVKTVTDNFSMLTPGQAALGSAGTACFGQKKFLRETINTATDSELDPMWRIFLSKSLNPARGTILKSATTLYRVRMGFEDVDGFRTVQCDELDSPVVRVTMTANRVYDPVTDTYKPSTVTYQALAIDASKAYADMSEASEKVKPGDISLVVSKSSATPGMGTEYSFATGCYQGRWSVVAVMSELDSWLLQLRRL